MKNMKFRALTALDHMSGMTKKGLQAAVVAGTSLAMVATAHAAALDTQDPFYQFFETVNGWATGSFGVGVAISTMLMGALAGISKNNPIPALSGVAGGALLHWGPGVIQRVMVNGGLM